MTGLQPWTAYRKLQLIANGGAVALGVDWWRKAAKEGCDRIAELEKQLSEVCTVDHLWQQGGGGSMGKKMVCERCGKSKYVPW